MPRALLTMFSWLILLVACKGEAKRHGPPLTPLVANQLKALSGECEIRAAKDGTATRELRLCKGRSSLMTIHLDENRNLRQLEIGVWAPFPDEARILLEQTLRGLISEKAVAAMTARLGNAKSDPVWVDNVRVNAFVTKADKENPRYTVDLAW
jgi:hypothetical protein